MAVIKRKREDAKFHNALSHLKENQPIYLHSFLVTGLFYIILNRTVLLFIYICSWYVFIL